MPVELSGQPRNESRWNKHRHEYQRDPDDRTCQVVHRSARCLAAGDSLFDIARDALDDDDRVVNDDADRQHDSEQRCEIDAEPKRRHRGEGSDDRHGNGCCRDEHRPPILQEDENDDQNQNCGLDQGLINLSDRGSHELRRVIGCHIDKVRREALSEGVHLRLDSVGDRNGIGVRQEGDADAGSRPAVKIESFAVGLRSELDAADVADSGDLSAVRASGLDDDVLEFGGIVEATFEVERILKILAFGRRRCTGLAGGDFLALLLDGVDHILRRQAPRLQQVRIHPNTHGVLPGAKDRHAADTF